MVLPVNTFLGELKFKEVYNFYDFPRFFSVTNNFDDIYFVYWFDETEKSNIWLYVRASELRFNQIRSGKIDIRDAYIHSENEKIIIIETDFKNQLINFQFEHHSKIDKEFLPPINDRLSLITPTKPILFEEELVLKSKQMLADVLNMGLEIKDENNTIAPIKLTGNVLINFQELVETIGVSLASPKDKPKTKTVKIIKEKLGLSFDSIVHASFSITMISTKVETSNIFNDEEFLPLLQRSLYKIFQIFKSKNNFENLKKHLILLGEKPTKDYKKLISYFYEQKIGFHMEWASPNQDIKKVNMNLDELKTICDWIETIETMKDKNVIIIGVLKMADSETLKFKIKSGSDYYIGFVDKQNIDEISLQEFSHAEIEATYQATIRVESETSNSGATNTKNYLIEFKRYGKII